MKPDECQYRLLDESFVLPICLHGGPVSLSQLPDLAAQSPFEQQFSLPAGSHARFLKEISRLYGACGVTALDGDRIVGFIRFTAKVLEDALSGFCLQGEDTARRMSDFDMANLPDFRELDPKTLWIECYQVIEDYQSRGIGSALLQQTIAWAREFGWKEIDTFAHQHIFPLLAWSGQMSVQSLEKLGFRVISQRVENALKEGVVSQRAGHHGKNIQRLWQEHYAHLSDDEAAMLFTMKLTL